ncbi:hypothetical protein PT974_06972 [Cladobotryum mycophilum]|uniref:Uncharacterized protein n=1 Tax=Cladobotryum mycophilum TaxID=491253 RepID=A0ABR0SMX5_9HYPO
MLPGDIVQIVLEAYDQGWTNIVSETSIKINYYESKNEGVSRDSPLVLYIMTYAPWYHRADSSARRVLDLIFTQLETIRNFSSVQYAPYSVLAIGRSVVATVPADGLPERGRSAGQ